MKPKLIGLCLALGLLAGCDQFKDYLWGEDGEFSRSYIIRFVETDTASFVFSEERNMIHIDLEGKTYWAFNSASKSEFESLCTHFGDISYNREVFADGSERYLADEFSAIDITSDRDFDATHPAGTSLGDIGMFYGLSAAPFIASGYEDNEITKARDALYDEFRTYRCSYGRYGDMPIKKLVNDLTFEDLRLLYSWCGIRFTVPPPAGHHTFTITFRSAEKTLTQTLAVEIQ